MALSAPVMALAHIDAEWAAQLEAAEARLLADGLDWDRQVEEDRRLRCGGAVRLNFIRCGSTGMDLIHPADCVKAADGEGPGDEPFVGHAQHVNAAAQHALRLSTRSSVVSRLAAVDESELAYVGSAS